MTDTSDEKEIYKPVKYENFGDFYDVSNFGNVKLRSENRIINQSDTNGYLKLWFQKPYAKSVSVSRIVALTFCDNPNNYNIVNHIDENKHNNHSSNLEWTTQKDNINKSTKDKTHKKSVIQKDLRGNIINIFNSINEAAEKLGVNRKTISNACVDRKLVLEYLWEYEDDKNYDIEYNIDISDAEDLTFISDNLKNYYVFKNGKVYNEKRSIFLKPCQCENGSLYISLSVNKKKKNFYIHQLVAMCYLPNPQGKSRVKHKDGNKSNNSVENLEWWY